MAERGINLREVLGKQFSKTTVEIEKMVSKGEVSFADFARALESLNGPGGQFQNMMAERSRTVNGLLSTLSDNVKLALGAVGKQFVHGVDAKFFINEVAKIPAWFEANAGALQPFWDGIGEGLHTIWDVAVATGEALGPVLTDLGQFAGRIVANFVEFDSVRDLILKGLHAVGTGLAYVFDAARFVGGAFYKYIYGTGVSAIRQLVGAVKGLFRELGKVGDEFGGAFFRGAADALEHYERFAEGASRSTQEIGDKLMSGSFGDTARMIDGVFEKVKAKADAAGDAVTALGDGRQGILDAASAAQMLAGRLEEVNHDAAKGTGLFEGYRRQLEAVAALLPALGAGGVFSLRTTDTGLADLLKVQRELDGLRKKYKGLADRRQDIEKGLFKPGFPDMVIKDITDQMQAIEKQIGVGKSLAGELAKVNEKIDAQAEKMGLDVRESLRTPFDHLLERVRDLRIVLDRGKLTGREFALDLANHLEKASEAFTRGDTEGAKYLGRLRALRDLANQTRGAAAFFEVPKDGILELEKVRKRIDDLRRLNVMPLTQGIFDAPIKGADLFMGALEELNGRFLNDSIRKFEDLADAAGKTQEAMELTLPKALVAGTEEAVSALNKYKHLQFDAPKDPAKGGGGKDALAPLFERTAKSTEEEAKNSAKAVELLREIARKQGLKVAEFPQ